VVTVRRAVRVVLIDPADRVLLMRFLVPDEPAFWVTIGGGIDPGESPEQAALREVREEVGLTDLILGPLIWTRRESFRFLDEDVDQSEQIFMARVADFDPVAHQHSVIEAKYVTDMRWWSLAELETADEQVYPRRLAEFYARLLAEGPPASPIDVGP
jgi:8-oxo-dGTP pyrophosphatase MutT (NUDIX family)